MGRAFGPGERVLLVDSKGRRYLITLSPGGNFSTHAGTLQHDEIIGTEEGVSLRTSHGARLLAVRPTLSEFILKMPRGAQVIYPKDIGPILILADIFPGARIDVGQQQDRSEVLRIDDLGAPGHLEDVVGQRRAHRGVAGPVG